MQDPLRKQISELLPERDLGGNQPAQDPALLAAQKNALDAANSRAKLLSAAAIPLSKEINLLEAYQKNLQNWRAAIKSKQSSALKDLLLRLLGLGLLLGMVRFQASKFQEVVGPWPDFNVQAGELHLVPVTLICRARQCVD
jgi:hypothetical protein